LFSHAYLAVDFFFMLSGFVIDGVYAPRFAIGMPMSSFATTRIRRLWPTMAIGLMMGAALSLAQQHQVSDILVGTLTGLCFVPIVSGTLGLFVIDGIEWSLFFELVANAVHRLVLWRLTTAVLFALVLGSLGFVFWLAQHYHGIGFGDRGVSFVAGFARVALSYTIGICLQRLWLGGRCRARLPRVCIFMLLPACFGLATLVPPHAAWLIEPLMVVTVFPALIWFGASAKLSPKYTSLAAEMGILSYPIYAIHLPLLGFGELVAHVTPSIVGIIARLSALAACFAFASLIARFVEKPLMRRPA
jgi:peptidoglycan/LPS O-acetylase OafA/YrhL